MHKIRNIFIAFVIFALVGCAATLPPPKPLAPQRAIIGISVKVRAPIKVFTDKADRVYFIKVDKEEDLYNQQNLILSNYAKGGQVYLLNAKPGRYAAVVVCKSKRMPMLPPGPPSPGVSVSVTLSPPSESKFTTFLSKEIIKLTEVTVAPESMVYMGEYVVNQSIAFKDADDVQLHYIHLLAPDAKTGVFSMGLSGKCYYTGSLHEKNCDREAEIRFLANALEQFEGTGWINIIQKRMEEVKAEK